MSCNIEYKIKYSKRKTILISVNNQGEVLVTAPNNIDINEVEGILNKKEKWIINKINEVNKRKVLPKDIILYLGKEHKVNINIQKYLKREFVMFYNEAFTVNVRDENNVLDVMKNYLIKKCEIVIKDKIKYYSKYFEEEPTLVKIKDVKSRWGSCTYDNKIYFNYRLVMADEKVIEYVVVHEMCHMVHKNHSKEYWDLVEKIYPNYKKYHVWLKENTQILQILHLQP